MDEVNHVKMAVSFVLFLMCWFLFLGLHDGYERSLNVLNGEKITKILFLQTC